MTTRYRFLVDESCHNYLVPDTLVSKFHEELEKEWDVNEFDDLFGQYRIDAVSGYTFENPKEE